MNFLLCFSNDYIWDIFCKNLSQFLEIIIANDFIIILLEKEFFTTGAKATIVYDIAKSKFPKESEGLLKKIHKCLEIRNKLAHSNGIEEKWDVVGYKFGKGEKKQIKKIEILKEEYYQNYRSIVQICMPLIQELRCDLVVERLTKCVVSVDEAKSSKLITAYITFYDSEGNTATFFMKNKYEFDRGKTEIAKDKIREIILNKYPKIKNQLFDITIQELEYPEPEYPNPEE